MKKEPIYLIDGSAYVYRAYHAIAPLSNSKGIPTNATYGFITMMRRLIKEKEPSYMCVAFDSRGPVFRHEMYADYKANRPPMPDDLAAQIPYIKSVVRGFNLPLLEQQGVEADDIIATLALRVRQQGHEVVVVSGDKDLLQLAGDGITIWDPMKNKEFAAEDILTKYGVPVQALLDYFALIGDSSDNVPGVPGVGPKTAAKLIGEYGSLDGLYAHVHEMKKSKMQEKILANKDLAYLSRDLIRLKDDVELQGDVEQYRIEGVDNEALSALYKELEFHTLLQETSQASHVSSENFVLVQGEEELTALCALLAEAKAVVIDTETTSLDTRKAELVGISLCMDGSRAWYLPIGHRDERGTLLAGQFSLEVVRKCLQPILTSEVIMKIGHNLKYDFAIISNTLETRMTGPLFDTMVASYLLDPGRRSYKLDDLSLEMGMRLTSFEEVVSGDKREDSFAYVSCEHGANYSCEDVYASFRLYEKYLPKLKELDLEELFKDIEMPIVPILADMEGRGIALDQGVLDSLGQQFTGKIAELEGEIHELAGEAFNINSPKQLGTILFEKLELPFAKKTKTGYSTDVKVLEKLATKHPLPARILEYRSLTKLQSTYVEKLGNLRDPETGRVYTSFNQTVTATGRLSSSNPNLQNIPIRTEEGNRIRSAFVPGEEMIFLSADYSQIDLRVLAHYSQDPALLKAFRSGDDIHESTAREIFSNPMFVTKEMRRVAKSINFGIVYGMSSFGLSNQLGLSRKDAQTFIERYFAHYSGVKQFMQDIVEQARCDGYVTTLCKRRRVLPDINAKNKNQREFAERIALNTPIQGTAADIIKLAMIKVEEYIAAEGLQARLLLQIHDELVFELPEEEREVAEQIIGRSMETALPLDVPLRVNFEVGHSLAKG